MHVQRSAGEAATSDEAVTPDALCHSAVHFRDPSGLAQRLLLDQARPKVVIGRGPACDLVIAWDDQVSREHAKLELVGENWIVVDDGLSRNGTFVNGERVLSSRRLRHQDRLLVGRTLLTFRAGRPETTKATAASDTPLIRLTQTQRMVLRALCRPLTAGTGHGMPASNRQIADELFLSVETVKDHLSQLYVRFGLETLQQNEKRLALARRAVASGLV